MYIEKIKVGYINNVNSTSLKMKINILRKYFETLMNINLDFEQNYSIRNFFSKEQKIDLEIIV